MPQPDFQQYEAQMSVLVNTRLLFNTMAEFEDFIGNYSIHSNGIRRCFPTPQRLRSLYRDCDAEVGILTHDYFGLGWLMRHYERAWKFYKANLARRKAPHSIATILLGMHFGTYDGPAPSRILSEIYEDMEQQKVNVALLTLLLLKALPGYDSKSGDVTDIDAQFDKVLHFLGHFTSGCGAFDVLPVITRAREETLRTRLMLVYHAVDILDTYRNYTGAANVYQSAVTLKENSVDLDLDGFWTSPGSNDIWKIDNAINRGVYFATRYRRESPRLMVATRYTVSLIEDNERRLTAYVLHPEAMMRRIKGHSWGDRDNAWYIADMPQSDVPARFLFTRLMHSASWPLRVELGRVNDPSLAARLQNEISLSAIIDAYEECNYTFFPSIWAITQEAVFVVDDTEECYYRLPRHTEHNFESIAIDDNVGIFEMGDQRYLGIDERLLYIPLSRLADYGIEKVYSIE